jgi:uncharacterized protein YcbK (DUF882 family)
MGDLSQHFDSSEFSDHQTGSIGQKGIDPKLIRVLECIRASGPKAGQPLRVVSGYRSPETNRAVGGARRSQHIYGRAADIEPGRCSVDQALRCGAIGVGYNGNGWVVHVDTRPGHQVTFQDG